MDSEKEKDIVDKEQEIHEKYVERMVEIARSKTSEIDELRLVGAFIKDQKISSEKKRRKPTQSIRDAAVDDAKLPFIKNING